MKTPYLVLAGLLGWSITQSGAQVGTHTRAVTSKLILGKPVHVGSISLVPILSQTPLSHEKYITLSQAMKQGLVEIVEIPGQAEVNTLEVRNRAGLPLLLVAGELLLGGKQDRIVAKDTVVPSHESRQVPVFCVEHGRWESGKTSFVPADTYVPDTIRRKAVASRSQVEVWNEVADETAAARATSATGTLRALVNDPKVSRQVSQTAAKLSAGIVADATTVGAICWMNGRIHSADIFANAAIFAANRDKLIRSYCADMVLSVHPKSDAPDLTACAKFLAAIVNSQRTLADKSRFDATYTVKDGKVSGYESGLGGFGGGLGGASGGMAGSGFGHGSYRPNGGP